MAEHSGLLLSATQIDLWTDCQRRWGFKYLERIETPLHPAAALGTEVQDTQIDPYLATGRNFDFTRPSGEIAQKLVPLLPAPMTPGMRLRRKFMIPSPSHKFDYQGEFDIWAPHASCVPGLETSALQFLGDIKTTSNLNYAKTEDQLKIDTQAQLYSMAIMFEENVNDLDLVWFYTKTKKAYRAQRTHLRIAAPHVVEQFERIDAIGQKLITAKLARPNVNDLEPNALMCDKYPPHGCPYRNRCNLSPAIQAAAINREAVMEAKTNDWLKTLMVDRTGVSPLPPPQVMAEVLPKSNPELAKQLGVVAPVAINPPESALPPAPPVGVAAAAEEKPKRGRPRKEAPATSSDSGLLEALEQVGVVVERMKVFGIKRLRIEGTMEIELS